MDNLIGMKEMARSLGISVKALRIRVSKGKIDQPVKRVGDELFWHRGTEHLGTIGCTESLNIYMHSVLPMDVKPLDIYGSADGYKPLVLEDSDNLMANQRKVDALIALEKTPLPRGTTMHILKGRQPVVDNDVKSALQPLVTSLSLDATEEQIQAAVDAGFINKEQHQVYLQRGTAADFDPSVMDNLTAEDLTYALPTGGLRRDEMVVIGATASKDKGQHQTSLRRGVRAQRLTHMTRKAGNK